MRSVLAAAKTFWDTPSAPLLQFSPEEVFAISFLHPVAASFLFIIHIVVETAHDKFQRLLTLTRHL